MASRMPRMERSDSIRKGLVAIFLAGAVFAPILAAPDAGAKSSRAGVVVNHGNGSADTECVRFNGDAIRAINALSKTSFDLYTQSFGGGLGRAVCWLDGEGYAPGSSCFGPTFDSPSWGVWLRKRGRAEPRQQNEGVSTLNVPAGGVLHLVFDTYDPPDFVQTTPDAVTLKSICEA